MVELEINRNKTEKQAKSQGNIQICQEGKEIAYFTMWQGYCYFYMLLYMLEVLPYNTSLG